LGPSLSFLGSSLSFLGPSLSFLRVYVSTGQIRIIPLTSLSLLLVTGSTGDLGTCPSFLMERESQWKTAPSQAEWD
jgi:hypothetical protein